MGEYGSLISRQDVLLIKEKLASLINQPMEKYQRNLMAMGYLNYLFSKLSITPIVVGGHAVELYTAGHYTTVDIDLVLAQREKAKEILELVGFELSADLRHWYNEELGIPIEIPDHTLAGSQEKVIEIQTEEGFSVYVIGLEDLILDRARSAYYWKHSDDRHWALSLIVAQFESIDFNYLENTSKTEDIHLYDYLTVLIKEAKNVLKEE